jgi:hypothetical protein
MARGKAARTKPATSTPLMVVTDSVWSCAQSKAVKTRPLEGGQSGTPDRSCLQEDRQETANS